jgi:hypothetical protein
MLQPRPFALVFLSLAGLAIGETRFGRPVAKLANPKEFEFVNFEDARFPVIHKNAASVACMAYREQQRYYVEVAVTNPSAKPIMLSKDFVQLKSDAGFSPLDTLAVAADVERTGAAPTTPQLSASRASSISSGTITSGDDRNGNMLAAIARTTQEHANQLATRLKTMGHERQSLSIEPGGTRFYVFVFEQAGRKKGPFEIAVATGAETLVFPYKE